MSKPGYKRILFCDKDTLATTPTHPIYMGLRNESKVNITPFKGVKEYQGSEFRNMRNFRHEVETYQVPMFAIKTFLGWVNCNCDIEICSAKQSSAGAQDVFAFAGSYFAGIDLEAVINNDKRSLKIITERALYFETAQTFIDGADAATPKTIAGLSDPLGIDYTAYRSPFFLAAEAPKTTALFSPQDILERSLSFKTKTGKKSQYNTSIVDKISFELILKVRDASIAKLITQMNRDMGPTLYWKEGNGSTYFDAFDFAANTLIQTEEFENTDEDRTITLKFSRDIDLFDITFEFGADKGGDEADTTGAKGGTMLIGQ